MNTTSSQSAPSVGFLADVDIRSAAAAGTERFALPAQLDLAAARGLKESLSPYLGRSTPLLIDAGAVSKMSTACAQVLLTFVIAARRSSISVHISPASHVFAQSIALLGLSHVFEESRS